MPIVPHLATLAAIAEGCETPAQFSFALRDFLDGYYPSPTAQALADEPGKLESRLHDDGYADAYLAAVAEYLSEKQGYSVPAWARDPTRTVRQPRFAMKTPEGRIFLLVESPAAFRSRNIFISADALSRV